MMKKILHLAALSIVSISQLLLVVNQVPAQAQTQRTFADPSLDGVSIAGCLKSYRFQNPCTEAARTVIANNFCLIKGYRSAFQYQVRDLGWKNRGSMWAWWEVYNNGKIQTNFTKDVSSFRFTMIECRR